MGCFVCSHYASCLEYLGNLKTNLLLDIHLHDHVETLYEQIRSKALIQYTLPFVSVDLNMMANAFNTSVTGLEKELEALITNDQIQVINHLCKYIGSMLAFNLELLVTCFLCMICTGMILQARIDSHNKILYARHADQRNGTFQRVLQTGTEFDRELRAMLLRANLIKHDYNLKAARKH